MNANKLMKIEIPQQVKVRKYDIDIENLKNTLRNHKSCVKITNKEISNKLKQPITLVEHWFRTDDSFSIPSDEIWFDLKELLHIETNEFDKSIMCFEIRDGVYEKSNRCYSSDGICPTLTATSSETEKIIVYNYL